MTEITDAHRARLADLADQLIPAGGGMPPASAAGVAGEYLDEVLRARPDYAEPLAVVLEASGDEPAAEVVARLRDNDDPAWAVLTAVVPGAYFMNPSMREAIGYPGLEARPIDSDAQQDDLGLLDAVIARGPVYRPTP